MDKNITFNFNINKIKKKRIYKAIKATMKFSNIELYRYEAVPKLVFYGL